jgi:hypothetical protein
MCARLLRRMIPGNSIVVQMLVLLLARIPCCLRRLAIAELHLLAQASAQTTVLLAIGAYQPGLTNRVLVLG